VEDFVIPGLTVTDDDPDDVLESGAKVNGSRGVCGVCGIIGVAAEEVVELDKLL